MNSKIIILIISVALCSCLKEQPNKLTIKTETSFDSAYLVLPGMDTVNLFMEHTHIITFDNIYNGAEICITVGSRRLDTTTNSVNVLWKTFNDTRTDYLFIIPNTPAISSCFKVN